MIMSQEQAFLKSQQQLQSVLDFIEQSASDGQRIDLVERELFSQLLAIGLTLLNGFVGSHGDGDAGEQVEVGQQQLRRMAQPHPRRYLSIFGELSICRVVYAVREGQKIQHAPLDQQLGLPAGEFSYVLEDWLQRLCVKESFTEAVTSLKSILGIASSQRAAEVMNQKMARQSEPFQLQQAPPPSEEEGEILVVTSDGKGVPMRRPLEQKIRDGQSPHGTKERAGKKQMAYVGGVYSIDRFRRTADDVVDDLRRHERAADRPQPQHKQVWAEMTSDEEGIVANGRERTFIKLAVACHTRDPQRDKPLVCLLDGERALWQMAGEWLPRAVGVLDLFHVLERLWLVAWCVHAKGSIEAQAFVDHRLRMLLEGKVGYVIGGLRRLAVEHNLRGEKLKTVNAAITYYDNNREHMRYNEYLAAGYPIGSGVAEGACRHLVKDRLEGTGMRWTVCGAQAMLALRSIHLNGQWDDYVNFRIQTEQNRLYWQTAA